MPSASDFADFLPHGVAHSEDHGLDPAAFKSLTAAGVAWRVFRALPWYLWAMGALYLYGRYIRGNGRREERKTRCAPTAVENAPRRPDAPVRDIVYRGASPLAMPQPSSPNLERRGSFRRYSLKGGAQVVEDRPRSSSALRNAYTSSRSGLSLPRPPPSMDPLQQQDASRTFSTSALPDQGARPSASALRNVYPTPSASAPVVPTSSTARLQRKRGHDDDENDDKTGEADKRTRVDETGAYDFDPTDDEDALAMELDSDPDRITPPPPPKRGTKRRDEEAEGEAGSKRSRTAAPEPAVLGPPSRDPAGKKRRASSGSSATSLSEAASDSEHQQTKKKARKVALGTGSVRDKRAVDDTSFDDEVDEDALEGSDDETTRERNADSDVDSVEAAAETPDLSPPPPKGKVATTPGPVKRFRSRRERSGSDDDDLMGDVEPTYGSSATAAGGSSASSPAPKSRRGTPRNARIGRVLAQQARRSTPQQRRRGDPATRDPTPPDEDLELVGPYTPRKPGDEWTNHEGDRYRIDADGTQRRLCEVREKRLKFRMPKDSKHPDARATHVVIVEKWLTAEEYEQAFAHRKLAWQTTLEEEARQQRMQDDISAAASGRGSESPAATPSEQERTIYYTRGVGTPLRAYRNLEEILARPGAVSAAGGTGSPGSASPRASPLLSNGRMRLASGASSRTGTPRSMSRKWSEHEVKRLLEGEEAARAEREKRRQGYLALGGDLYETEQERKEREAKEEKEKKPNEPAKIKLADYGLTAPAKEKGKETKGGSSQSSVPSLFGAPASASTTAPAVAAAPTSKFGTADAPGIASAAPSIPAEAKKTAAAPAFSFGAIAKKDESTPAAASKPLFGAGPTTETKTNDPKPAFSFGASSSVPSSTEKKEEAPKGAPFSFGAGPKADGAFASSTPAPAFTLGAAPTPPKATNEAPAPVPAFSFDSAPKAPESKDEASKPAFSFGAPAVSPAEKKDEAPFGSAVQSLFGAAASPAAPATTEASKPTFAFGASPASTAPTPSTAPAPFSFGGAPTGSRPSEEAKPPSAPAFSFGAAAPTAPAAASMAGPGAPAFSFGSSTVPIAPSPAPATQSSGFSFGQTPATDATASAPAAGGFSFGQATRAPASTGFSFGGTPAASPAATAPTGFSYGASPGLASPAAGTGFSFGASATAAPSSTPMFSFGSTGDESANGSITPRRRPTRRLPNRQG